MAMLNFFSECACSFIFKIFLPGNTFFDGRYWFGLKLPLRSSDNYPLPIAASCSDSTVGFR